jgi:hypothetical protein
MSIINTLRNLCEDRSQRANDKHRSAVEAHYKETIQVKEFNGELYISFDGIPVVALADLNASIVDIVSKARQTAVAYTTKGGAR